MPVTNRPVQAKWRHLGATFDLLLDALGIPEHGHTIRLLVLRGLWREVGRIPGDDALRSCMRYGVWPNDRAIEHYENDLLDAAIERLLAIGARDRLDADVPF